MKVVINKCFGGFGLSEEALNRYNALKGGEPVEDYYDIARDDEYLVQVVEELKDIADSWASELKVVEIPDGIDYVINEYDGNEWIAEVHRTWY